MWMLPVVACRLLQFYVASFRFLVLVAAPHWRWACAPARYSSQRQLSSKSKLLVVLNVSWAPGQQCSSQRQVSSRSTFLNVSWAPGQQFTPLPLLSLTHSLLTYDYGWHWPISVVIELISQWWEYYWNEYYRTTMPCIDLWKVILLSH